MQIDRERVHRDDFARTRTRDVLEPRRQLRVIVDPGPQAFLVSQDAEPGPRVELLRHARARGERLQAQRMAAKVEQGVAGCIAWVRELIAKAAQRIDGIERTRRLERGSGQRGRAQLGFSMRAPQCLQVRSASFEKKRSNTGGNCVSMFVSAKNSSYSG